VRAEDHACVALHLNLDAEDELARGASFAHTRSAATRAALERAAVRLAPLLPAHLVPRVPGSPSHADGARGVQRALCWCPTPGALSELRAAGLEPVTGLEEALGRPRADGLHRGAGAAPSAVFPAADALARANERATFALTAPLVTDTGASAVAWTFEDAEAHLAAAPAAGNWILRRGLSAAGRGARRVRGGACLAAGDAAWLRASLALGPVTLDPRVELVRELALHGWVGPDGATTLGAACLQHVDVHGAWRATERAGEGAEHAAALRAAAADVAATLHGLRYHGPFGIDAYVWRAPDGALHLRAPSEVNARFSMGWWTGMRAP